MRLFNSVFCLLSFIIDLRKDDGDLVMVINLVRHGSRTPVSYLPELEPYFHRYNTGALTYNGWRQQILVGKYMRNKYITNSYKKGKTLVDPSKASSQFLIFSSPYARTIDTSCAFTLGLLPDHNFNLVNYYTGPYANQDVPPIKDLRLDNPTFNMILPDKFRDVLFHGRKCRFKGPGFEDKDVGELLDREEKRILYVYLKEQFPITFLNMTYENMNESMVKSMHSAIKCANFNFENDVFPADAKTIEVLNKFLIRFYYDKKLKNDNITKMISSQFFDHVLSLMEHKIKGVEKPLDFYNLTTYNYTDLRLVTYSGHDINLIGFLKNIVNEQTLESYKKDPNKYVSFLAPDFASSIELLLFKYDDGYHVKILYNGRESIQSLRSVPGFGEINYIPKKGIPYPQFKKLFESRIYPNYDECDFKKSMTFDEDR